MSLIQQQPKKKKVVGKANSNSSGNFFTTLHFLRNFINGLNTLEGYSTLSWRGIPGQNTLAFQSH